MSQQAHVTRTEDDPVSDVAISASQELSRLGMAQARDLENKAWSVVPKLVQDLTLFND